MAISQDKVRAKVFAVREAIMATNVNNEQICLVLQYYDNDVNRTISAFIEDGAKEALQQWQTMGGKASSAKSKKKKGKNKKKGGTQNGLDTVRDACSEVGSESVSELTEAPSCSSSGQLETNDIEVTSDPLIGGDVDIASIELTNVTAEPSSSPLQSTVVALDLPDLPSGAGTTELENVTGPPEVIPITRSNHLSNYQLHSKKGREQIKSIASDSRKLESSADLTTAVAPKKPPMNLEKSFKDLHRQKVSLERLKIVLSENVDKSFKRVAEVFKELRKELTDREASIVAELNEVKANANKVLEEQETRGKSLRLQADRTSTMSETDLLQLRANIKEFVSNRKVFEDMCSARMFSCSVSHVIEDIRTIGEVSPVKVASGTRSTSSPLESVSSGSVSHSATIPIAANAVAAERKEQPPSKPASSGLHVLMQSESLTRYEENERRRRLENSNGDISVPSTRSSISPAAQGLRRSLTPAEQAVLSQTSRGRGSPVRRRGSGAVRGRDNRQNGGQYDGTARSYASSRTFYNSQVAASGLARSDLIDVPVARSVSQSRPNHRQAVNGIAPAKNESSTVHDASKVAHNGHNVRNGVSSAQPSDVISSPVVSSSSHSDAKSSTEDTTQTPLLLNGLVPHTLGSTANGFDEGTEAIALNGIDEIGPQKVVVDASNGLPQRVRNPKQRNSSRPPVPFVDSSLNSSVTAEGQGALACSG